jgi:peptidoglycan/xylan/chitin deacetylase (PgdA/CDA1 family)
VKILRLDQFLGIGTVRSRLVFLLLLALFFWSLPTGGEAKVDEVPSVPILLYHRFGPVAADGMTVSTTLFESHLKYLRDNGYTVISLRQLVDHYLGKAPVPPFRSFVITVDDGHKTVYTDMFPLLKKYRFSATLFIYPSAISNASYAVTWDQIKEMKESGFFDVQSHTFWHPNFKKERERLKPSDYEQFVEMQLKRSKAKLEEKLVSKIDMLAWPFGICDDALMAKASQAGYVATFTLERHHASSSDNILSLPRYLITHSDRKAVERIMSNGHGG